MAKKTKAQKEAEKLIKETREALEDALEVADAVDETEEEVTETVEASPEIKEEITGSLVEAPEARAAKSDSVDSLRQFKNAALKIGDHELNPQENRDIKAATENHYRLKGLRFRGRDLDQETLDKLLKETAYLKRIGHLRIHIKK